MIKDTETFEQILRETQHMIRAYIAGLGTSSDEVDDIAQDVYITFYNNMHKMPEDATPVRWLKGIARNMCMNHFRRTKREQAKRYEAIAELLSQSEDTENDEFTFATAFDPLRECMQKLSASSQKLISMKYEKNMNAKAISAETDMNSGAVRMALLRIRESLRLCIENNITELVVHEQ